MMNIQVGMPNDFKVSVTTTNNRSLSTPEIAKLCTDKIVSVSDTAPPEIRAQAEAFKAQVQATVEQYLHLAVSKDRDLVYNHFVTSGHEDVADIVRSL